MIKSIDEVTGNNFIIENKIPPHVTIGVFHAAKDDEANLIQRDEEISKTQKSGVIQFKEVSNFKGKVLFLKLEKKNGFLTQINGDCEVFSVNSVGCGKSFNAGMTRKQLTAAVTYSNIKYC